MPRRLARTLSVPRLILLPRLIIPRLILPGLILLSLAAASAPPPSRALTVFDPANYAQNLLQAARALEQINNQIQSLQHELLMLQNMARDLERLDYSALDAMSRALQRVLLLIAEADGIAFDLYSTDQAWRRFYPEAYAAAVTGDQLAQDAHQRWLYAMDGLQHSLRLQAQLAGDLVADRGLVEDLLRQSQAAAGNLQVSQAANQLLALQLKQQMQDQALAVAQYRAAALEQARQAMAQEQARAQFARFIGSSSAAYAKAPGAGG